MKFHHVAITVKDLSISIPFYGDFFGLKEIKRFRRDDMGATGCFFQNENVIVELWQFDNFKNGTREDLSFTGIKHIAFTDENPESIHKLFTDKGMNNPGAYARGIGFSQRAWLFDLCRECLGLQYNV